jgi:Tfp pilus assembly protein PilZ
MEKADPAPGSATPPEAVLRQVRVPHIQRAVLRHAGGEESVFVVDLGMRGVFVERNEPLPTGVDVEVAFPIPGNEIPVHARCRVAWWHPAGAPLVSKVLPAGLGLEFLEISDHDRVRIRAHVLAQCRRHGRARRFTPPWPA